MFYGAKDYFPNTSNPAEKQLDVGISLGQHFIRDSAQSCSPFKEAPNRNIIRLLRGEYSKPFELFCRKSSSQECFPRYRSCA